MKKVVFSMLTVFALILILPTILSIDLEIQKDSEYEVMIADVGQPATFNLEIKNNGPTGEFKVYNLLGFTNSPETIKISQGETKDIEFKIYPRSDLSYRGFYTMDIYFQDGMEKSQSEKIKFEVISLGEAFEIGSADISPEASSANIYVKNKKDFNFEEINGKFSSSFFKFEKDFSLMPKERKEFNVKLDQEEVDKLLAGTYPLNAQITVEDQTADVEGVMNFVEQDILTTTSKEYGLFVSTKVISKKNDGNTVTVADTRLDKNIITRLFTSFSPEPTNVQREGLKVYYTWNENLNPGESLDVTVRTNWLFPFLLIFFIVVIVALARKYSSSHVTMKKKVSFVRAKGGEFALKVSIIVNARDFVEKVAIVDRLPPLVSLYEKFGSERPTRVNEKMRRIEWNFDRLERGETRILSYVIYSKNVGVLGKFALPTTTAIYEIDGKIKESQSNRAFFVAEQKANKEEEI